MMPWRVVLIVVAVAAVWVSFEWLFPDDEARIRAVLERIADAVGGGAEQESEVARLARAASVRNQLDPQIAVDAGPPFSRISGRDAIIGTIARLDGTVDDLEVHFDDVAITVDPGGDSAKVHLTAEARYRDSAGARGFEARELDLTFRRLDGDWVLSDVAQVRTLEPITPR
jgi:hypothetical protein